MSRSDFATSRTRATGYIVSKRLRKSTASERRWAVSPDGYTVVSDRFRHKSRIRERTVCDETGK